MMICRSLLSVFFGGVLATVTCGESAKLCPSRLYPWEGARETLCAGTAVCRPDLMSLPWTAGGGPEGRLSIVDAEGSKTYEWRIKIDHHNAGAYPVGWPSCDALLKSGVDLSGHKMLSLRMRATRDVGHPQSVRVIIAAEGGGEGRSVNRQLASFRTTDWQEILVELPNKEWLSDVRRLHFYLNECDYQHGDEVVFQFKDFRLGEPTTMPVPLKNGLAGASLWVGDRADADSRAVILDAGSKTLPAVLHVENRMDRRIPDTATVLVRLRDVVTGRDALHEIPLGVAVPSGGRVRVEFPIDISGLKGSYYHALADILVDGKSVLDIRKGSDDFLLKRPGESMTSAMLLLRAGLASWLCDRIHGGFMVSTDISLPHAYDPYDVRLAAYGEFLRRFAFTTTKICEGYEAGMPGQALAAEAYRRAGDAERQAFLEGMLWNSASAMLTMQDPCGGALVAVNELFTDGIGSGGGVCPHNSTYNADQTAEWMRALSYAAFYYLRRGGAADRVRRLNEACLKAGRFLVANCRWYEKGANGSLQNFDLTLNPTGGVTRMVYHQAGRQCDVYAPRLVAGLSYSAVALMKSGERVPDEWWSALDASVDWMSRKMKPNGWFDWQCGDEVEDGCHTFLGNIYLGEGMFGAALANRLAGRPERAAAAIDAAHKAYRYVTDDCWVRGRRFECPIEFWTGPYVYWLFTEWNRHAGREPVFADWLATMDRRWREERRWGDFLRVPGMNCGRADTNGMLTVAILGYLGLREMEETGRPWSLFD